MVHHTLYEVLEERYPGLLKSKRHLKQRILKVALVNKLRSQRP